MITVLALLLCVGLMGCGILPGFLRKEGKTKPEQKPSTEQQTTKPDADAQTGNEEPEDAETDTEIAHPELIGNWQWVCETSYSGTPGFSLDEMDHYFNMADEIGGMDLWIYEEDGSLYADYENSRYESYERAYHLPIEFTKEPLYEGCINQEWSAKLIDPRTGDELFCMTIEEGDRLIEYADIVYGEGEDAWRNVEVDTFLREGSDELANKDELRYNETITVSDVNDLLRAIDNGKKIILKEGTYDLSKANERLKNVNVIFNNGWNSESGTVNDVKIRNVENLCLIAEEGKKVEICIDSPYDPVLSFDGCRNLVFKGITAGHHVEPGTCGGSVLQFYDSSKITLNDCHLYGCGTYGIEATNCSELNVEKSEIYECTYGIVDLTGVYDASFTDCKMHDNKDMDMISLSQCGTITFTDCEFRDNQVAAQQYFSVSFVRASECYDTALHHCTFTGNSYSQFNEGDVEIDNCSFKDTIVSSKED